MASAGTPNPSFKARSWPRILLLSIPVLIIVLVATYASAIKLVAPRLLADRLRQGVEDACDSCQLQIGSIETSFFNPGHLIANEIRFYGGRKETTAIRAHIEQLELKLSITKLRHRLIDVSELQLRGPFVELMDGDKHSPPSHSPRVVELPVQFVVHKTQLTGGAFRYVSEQPKLGTSRLEFTDIDGESQAIGNIPGLLEAVTHSTLSGVNTELKQSGINPPEPNLASKQNIEGNRNSEHLSQAQSNQEPNQARPNQAHIELEIFANYFVQPYHERVVFTAQHHPLKPMGEFLAANDGIQVKGMIRHAQATISMSGRHIHASMKSDYENLKVAILPTAERSSFSAGLMQLAVKLAVSKDKNTENTEKKKSGETSTAGKFRDHSITDATPRSPRADADIEKRFRQANARDFAAGSVDDKTQSKTFDEPTQDLKANEEKKSNAATTLDTQRGEYETVAHALIRALKEVSIRSAL